MSESRKAEWARKALHLTTIFIPLAIWFLPPHYWRWPLVALALAVLVLDLARLGDPRLGTFFRQILGPYLRRHEERELLGSTYLALACLLSAFLFPRDIAVAVMGYLILGDGLAGLVGRSWGRLPLAFGKSVEGTLTGLLANLLIGWLVFRAPGPALLGAGVASLAELLPIPLDDNFAIPMFAGAALWMGVS